MKELIFFYNHPQINGSKKIQTTNKLQSQSYKWLGFNGFFFFFSRRVAFGCRHAPILSRTLSYNAAVQLKGIGNVSPIPISEGINSYREGG